MAETRSVPKNPYNFSGSIAARFVINHVRRNLGGISIAIVG